LRIGEYSASGYEFFLIIVTILLLFGVWLTLRFTKLGLLARGTMQNAEMASALGVSTSNIYMITFGLGAAVSGLAGGLLAPITGVLPTIGATYIAKAFITVISGGAAILAGTTAGSILLGGINGVFSFIAGSTFGEIALLLAAIILLRLMPRGITGRFFRKSL
jgi:branched-chain amino acid transport system permease protein